MSGVRRREAFFTFSNISRTCKCIALWIHPHLPVIERVLCHRVIFAGRVRIREAPDELVLGIVVGAPGTHFERVGHAPVRTVAVVVGIGAVAHKALLKRETILTDIGKH